MKNFTDTANGWRFAPFHSLIDNNNGNYGHMSAVFNNNSKGGGRFNNFFSYNNNTSCGGINNNIKGSNVGSQCNPQNLSNVSSNFNTFGGNQNARMNGPWNGNIGHQNMMNNDFNGPNNFCNIYSFNPNGNFSSSAVNNNVSPGPPNTGSMHSNLCDAGIPDGYQRVQCTQPAVVVHCCPQGTCILIGNGMAGNAWEHVTWPQDCDYNLIPYPAQSNC